MKKYIRKILNRSGTGVCDICEKIKILIVHHINGKDIQDAEKFHNKTNICCDCHANVHYGNIIIEKWVQTDMGKKLIWHKRGDKSITGECSNPHLISSILLSIKNGSTPI